MEKTLIFLGMALVTFVTRFAGIAALSRQVRGSDEAGVSSLLRRWLYYVPAAVLAALVVPAVLVPQGVFELGLPAVAMLVGAIIAWRTRNVLMTILSGMAVYWLLKDVGL